MAIGLILAIGLISVWSRVQHCANNFDCCRSWLLSCFASWLLDGCFCCKWEIRFDMVLPLYTKALLHWRQWALFFLFEMFHMYDLQSFLNGTKLEVLSLASDAIQAVTWQPHVMQQWLSISQTDIQIPIYKQRTHKRSNIWYICFSPSFSLCLDKWVWCKRDSWA